MNEKLWEGWKKEIIWILFFGLILFMAYGFYHDKQEMDKIRNTECFQMCSFDQGVKLMQEQNPNLILHCSYETKSCEVYGYSGGEFNRGEFNRGGFNITFKEGDTNNTFKNSR